MPLIPAEDIEGLDEYISANAMVQAATLLRHDQLHRISSDADHSDMDPAAPLEGQILGYRQSDGRYGPVDLTVGIGDIDGWDEGTV